jgi:hypothetical protein
VSELFIDLDDEPPHRAPPRRRVRRTRIAAVVLAVAVVAGVAAAIVVRASHQLPLTATLPGSVLHAALDDDNLYVVRADAKGPDFLSAYAWSDGKQRWRQPLYSTASTIFTSGGGLYVTRQPCEAKSHTSVDRINPLSGAPLWQWAFAPLAVLGGDPAGSSPAPTLLVGHPNDGGCTSDRQVDRIVALDVDTGSPEWTVQTGATDFLATAAPGAHWIATWNPKGQLVAYDAGTGLVTASVTLHRDDTGDPADGAPIYGALIIGDTLILNSGTVDRSVVTAYRRGDLSQIWRRTVSIPGTAPNAQETGTNVIDCGGKVCLSTPDQLTVFDPVTGDSWQAPGLADLVSGPGVVLGRNRYDPTRLQAYALASGRPLFDLPGWTVVPSLDGATTGAVALIRESGGLAAVDLTTGARRTLEPGAGGETGSCALKGDRLACLTLGAQGSPVHVWRV